MVSRRGSRPPSTPPEPSLRSAARGLPGRELHRGRARAPAARTSPTSTGRCSRWSTCPRRSRARCSRAIRATRARCGGFPRRVRRRTCPTAGRRGWRQRARAQSRAAELYERIFLGYGDDSVAQLGGAHVACEWVSNVLTKVLQRPRLAAYLEQSTRYIAYDAPMPGAAAATATTATPSSAPSTRRDGRAVRDLLGARSRGSRAWAEDEFPRADGEPPAAHARAIKAKALDLLRGLLPAARCRTWASSPPARPTSS